MGGAGPLYLQCPVKCPPDAVCLRLSSTGPESGRVRPAHQRVPGPWDPTWKAPYRTFAGMVTGMKSTSFLSETTEIWGVFCSIS